MEKLWKDIMESFYERNNYRKGGGPGGKFVGREIRKIIAADSLEELRGLIGENSWIEYLHSIRNYYEVCVKEKLEDDSYIEKIQEFKNAFNEIYAQWNMSEIPKNHILATHVGEFLALEEETLWTCNDENLEACHQLGMVPLKPFHL